MHLPKILVVDDDENILSAFEKFLKGEHCSMIAMNDGAEALQRLAKHDIDLVITDVRPQYQSGVTFLLTVRSVYPDLPVIVVTGYPDLLTKRDAMTYGANFFFVKPLDLEQLRRALKTCLHFHNA